MTMLEVLAQAKALSVSERKELAKLLIDSLDAAPPTRTHSIVELEGMAADRADQEADGHAEVTWGEQLVHIVQQTEIAPWGDETIADPVEALQAQRRQEYARLASDWNGEQ